MSCKKDKLLTSSSARLTFSQDSILFDTVFTHIGSTTKLFRVHNPNKGKINISSLKLARGTASYFRLNVDGVAGKSFSDVEIAAGDSIYIFVEVTIDPTNQLNPFIYKDSILFELNGNQQHFDLIAFGQNAYYHMPNQKIIFSNTQALYYEVEPCGAYWKNDLPHLIYGYAVVDSACTLTVQAGAKIYLHGGAGIWVYRYGNIQVQGTEANPVTFQGDRLEEEYKDVPGQWDRIWINEGSIHNSINYAVIKNGYIGVHAGFSVFDGLELSYVTFPFTNASYPRQLNLSNTIIQNCSYSGILGHSYNITGGNDVVVNCGQSLCELDYGGNYTFYQCTFANYWNQTNNGAGSSARTTPSFVFNNYFNGNQLSAFDSLYFGNCILDGSLAEEFQFDTLGQGVGFTYPYLFDHCALKTGMMNSNGPHAVACPINRPMNYGAPASYNFDIPNNNSSGAWQAGSQFATGGYVMDIKGNSAVDVNHPNSGAYQQ